MSEAKKEKATRRFTIMFKPSIFKEIEKAADNEGFNNVGTFIRRVLGMYINNDLKP